jgi:murein DD-endopeptidase MepM/ murein hydrolase activator NlpD
MSRLRRALGLVPPSGSHSGDAEVHDSPRRFGSVAGQRLVGGAVAVLVIAVTVAGGSPVQNPAATGNVLGAGSGPRLVIGGGDGSGRLGSEDSVGGSGGLGGDGSGAEGDQGGIKIAGTGSGDAAAQDTTNNFAGAVPPASEPLDVESVLGGGQAPAASGGPKDPSVASQDVPAFNASALATPDGIQVAPDLEPSVATDSMGQGAFLSDGTILKPIAVDTSAPDARTLLTKYKVRKGDTLTSIAHHYGLSLVTVYWANHLTTNLRTKTDLKVGQTLSIPPVNGVLHIVTDKETLTDISKRTGVSVDRIVEANGLKQPTAFVGQWIIIPGAKAKPIPVVAAKPKPVVKPVTTPSASRPAQPASRPTIRPTYSGGGWIWPAPGGHISQYYHYGHWAIDIADDYGSAVLAARSGVVTFAGWKNNGGGWQVWISHGNGLYTTYNHMSSITVGGGQSVGGGQQVGRIGQSGHATGPHLHFEVWIGAIWSGGTRVNPLNYV